MRIFFILPLILMCLCSKAQSPLVKYYDAEGNETTKDKATSYTEFVKENNSYKCSSYWIQTGALRGRATYPDTIMAKPTGLQVLYFKNGNIEDSSFYDNDGKVKDAWHYYENKQLAMHHYVPENNREPVTEGFDETGKKIKNYVYEKEAEFKGGDKAWHTYILKHVSNNFSAIKTDVALTVTVKVQFVVDASGFVVRPKLIQSSGFKSIDMDAINVIASSPQWNNAIQYNRPVKAYRLQPITYVIPALKK